MKKIIIAILMLACCTTIQAQKYKKVFYKNQTIENKDVRITVDDAVSTEAAIKLKIRIKNLTTDYIIYKPTESSFKIGGKNINPTEKWLIIPPNEEDFRVVDLKGTNYKIAADFEFILDGLYKANASSKGTDAPDFKLPASLNEFKAGPFIVTLEKVKKETARTDAKFKVKYTGDKIAVFEPNKVAMKMPDGKEFANYHADRKPELLSDSEESFTVSWKDIPTASGDMQFAEMIILWREAFKEMAPVKLPAQTINVLFDKDITEAKGK